MLCSTPTHDEPHPVASFGIVSPDDPKVVLLACQECVFVAGRLNAEARPAARARLFHLPKRRRP